MVPEVGLELHLRVFADVKPVDAVVFRVPIAAIIDAASGDDGHVAVFADEKVVVHRLLQPAFGEGHRDVDPLP